MKQENPVLEQVVEAENPLKQMLVDYVGEKLQPDNEQVTVEMIVKVLADEFPEFVMVLAEENFIQGYKQAFADIESMKQKEKEQVAQNK